MNTYNHEPVRASDYMRCSNYIFILDLTPAFNGLGKDNCKTRWKTFKFGNLVSLIIKDLQYIVYALTISCIEAALDKNIMVVHINPI